MRLLLMNYSYHVSSGSELNPLSSFLVPLHGTAWVWPLQERKDSQSDGELQEKNKPLKLKGHNSYIWTVSFSKDNSTLATVTELGTVNLWSLEQSKLNRFEVSGEFGAFSQVIFNPMDEQQFATISQVRDNPENKNHADLWNLQNEKRIRTFTFEEHSNEWRPQVFFREDGQQLATFSADGTVSLWNLNGKRVAPLFVKKSEAREWPVGLDFKKGTSRLAIATQDGKVLLQEFQGNQLQEPKQRYPLGNGAQGSIVILNVAFSPDGRRLAAGSASGKAYLVDLQSGQSQELSAHQSRITSIHFRPPSGEQLLTASADGTARLWNLQGKQIQEPFEHRSPIIGSRFSLDGKQLVTVSWNKLARIWDVQTDGQVAQYRGENGLWDASFSPDSQKLVAVGWGISGQWWPLKPLDRLLKDGCDRMKDYRTTHADVQHELQQVCYD